MKKLLLFVLFGISVFLLVTIEKNNQQNNNDSSDDEVSGAYEALNFHGSRQMYPEKSMPAKGYYAAWEKWKTNEPASKNPNTAPWETLGPVNKGGRTLAIVPNPQNTNTLYAGSASGGLWRSYTAGVGADAWEIVPTGFPILGVSTIAFHPTDTNTMYIGTGEVYNYDAAGTGAAYRSTRGSYGIGILKTTDGGQTWSQSLDWSYNQEHGVWMIKFDPLNPSTLFAATTEGIYKSTDSGTTWNLSLNVVLGTDICIHPLNSNKIVAACGNFGSTGYGLYTTANGGTTWSKVTSGVPLSYQGKAQLGQSTSHPDVIYASFGNGFTSSAGASWLCRSDDFGTTWTIKNTADYSRYQGWFSHDVAVSPVNPDHITVIGIEIWQSIDGGTNLNKLNTSVHVDMHDVVYDPVNTNRIFVATDGGVSYSPDAGNNWFDAIGGYQTVQFYNGTSTSQNDTTFYIGGLQDNGTISWDGNLSWYQIFGGDGSWTAINPMNDNIFFVSYQRLNISRTFNGGNSFNSLSFGNSKLSPEAFIAPYVIAPSNFQVLYAGTSIMAKSTDLGSSWTTINAGNQLDGNPALSMEVAPTNEDVLYVGTAPYNGTRGHLFVTLNGNTFDDVTNNLPDRYPMDITVDPTDPATAYVVYSGFGTGHVFKTQDYGTSWADITDNLPDVPTNAVIVDPLIPSNVYIGNDLGIFVSEVGGTQWTAFQDGLPDLTMIFDLEISMPNRKLRAATHGNGAYQRDLLELQTPVEQIASETISLKVYPNPTDDYTTIEMNNKSATQTRIDLLDVNGRIIQTPLNQVLSTGEQLVEVNLSGRPAGVYFVRLIQGDGQIVKRLVKK